MSSQNLRSKQHRHASRENPSPPRRELRGKQKSDGKKLRSPRHSSSQKRTRKSPSPQKPKKSKHQRERTASRTSPPNQTQLPLTPVSSDVTRQSADSAGVTDRTLLLKQLLDERKQKRLRYQSPVQPSEAGDADDVRKWVEHSRKLELVPTSLGTELESSERETIKYRSSDLKGLKIGHGMGGFMEGEQQILTLKDREVLDEETEETLENPTMVDQDRANKNMEMRSVRPGVQDPFDNAQLELEGIESALRGERQAGNILSKYDEEISGVKTQSFYLADNGQIDPESSLMQESRQRESLLSQLGKREVDLNMEYKFASQVMTSEEIAEKFRRIKKRRKVVPLRAEELLSASSAQLPSADLGSRDNPEPQPDPEGGTAPAAPLSTFKCRKVNSEDMIGPTSPVPISAPPSSEEQTQVSSAIERIRRLRQSAFSRREMDPIDRAADIARQTQHFSPVENKPSSAMIFDSTQEFVRSLSTLPPRSRLHESVIERRPESDMAMELDPEGEEGRDGWKELKNGAESKTQSRPSEDREDYFEAEPIVSHSLTSTLLLAERKGFIEQNKARPGYTEAIDNPKGKNDISAKNYSLLDKQQARAGEQRDRTRDAREDYRERMRDRDSSFPEKKSYFPEIKLEYVDDLGRELSQKEAFRRMSHVFHGKGSGKLKAERRLKKSEDELSMKKMNSFDTPLNTVAMATRKMESSGIPYLILSGGQHSLETGSVTETGRLAKGKK